MPQQSAVPSSPVARIVRRVLLLAGSGLATLGVAGASAADGGGAEAGDPAVASAAAPRSVAAPVTPSRSTVRAVQRRLRVDVDGVHGPLTRAAVRRFQSRRGLRVDGRLGRSTLAALGLRAHAARATAAPAPTAGTARLLAAIARCESGGDPRAVSAGGRYRGKYQFHRSTWKAMGGTGDPAAASEAEQDRRAAALVKAEGTKPWPVCGRRGTAAT